MAVEDENDLAYQRSKQAERDQNLDAEFDARMKQIEAEFSAAPTSQPANPANTEAKPANDTQGGLFGDKVSSRSLSDLVADKPAVEGEQGVYARADIAKSALRGAAAAGADIFDNLMGLLNETADYIGLPDKNNVSQMGALRDDFDKAAGTPETKIGQFTQDAVGQVAAAIPIVRGLKYAKYISGAKAIFAGDFIASALTSRPGNQTLSGQIAEGLGADNWFVDVIKNAPDDSTAERMIRTGFEGALIGQAFDRAVKGVSWAYKSIKGTQARQAVLNAVGVEADEAVDSAVAELTQAKTELETLQAVQQQSAELTAPSASVSATPDAANVPQASALPAEVQSIVTGVDAKVAQLEAKVALAESSLAKEIDGTLLPPQVIKAIHADLKAAPNGISPELDNALSTASAKQGAEEVVQPAARVLVANHLELTADDAAKFTEALQNGDFDGAAEAYANSFDHKNYALMDDPQKSKDIVAGMASMWSERPQSVRAQGRVSHAETQRLGKEKITALASEYGTRPETIALKLQEQFPTLDFHAVTNAYDVLEQGTILRLQKAVDELTLNPSDKAKALEVQDLVFQAANISDMSAGIATSTARALESRKIRNQSITLDDLLGDIQGKAKALDQAVKDGGGIDAILKLAEQIRMATKGGKVDNAAKKAAMGTIRRLARKARIERDAPTVGDIVYSYVLSNVLSSPDTHLRNPVGPFLRTAIYEPMLDIMGGLGRAPFDNGEMLNRGWHTFAANWRNLTSIIDVTNSVGNASPLRASSRQELRASLGAALKTGQRQTAGGEAANVLSGTGNPMRADMVAQSLRAGLPMHMAFMRGRAKMLGPNGQYVAYKLADALDEQAAGNLRLFPPTTGKPLEDVMNFSYGFAAKGIDYIGRALSWSRHLIAGGDELVSGAAYASKLEADVFSAARKRGLTGKDFDEFVADRIKNAPMWKQIAETIDPKKMTPAELVEATAKLEEYKALESSAKQYVQGATFTQDPGWLTRTLMQGQHKVPALRWFTFFARTGSNIARSSIDVSAIGAAKQLSSQSADEQAKGAAKLAVNAAVAMKTYQLYTEDRITGSGPLDPEERALWLKDHQPYSFRYGNDWVSYAHIDPFATPIQVLVELGDTMRYMDDTEMASFTGEFKERMVRLIGSKTWLQGIAQVLGMFTGDVDISDVGIGIAKDFVPQSALLRFARRNPLLGGTKEKTLIDDGGGYEMFEGKPVPRREGLVAKTLTELGSRTQAGMPNQLQDEWADMLNRILDLKLERMQAPQRAFGGEIVNGPSGMGPVQVANNSTHPVYAELRRQGYKFDIKTRLGFIKGIELTDKQRDFMHKAFALPKGGIPILDLLQKELLDDPRWAKAGDTVRGIPARSAKLNAISNVVDRRVEAAAEATLKQFPELMAEYQRRGYEKDQVQTKAGSDALAAEVASRKSDLLRAIQELP